MRAAPRSLLSLVASGCLACQPNDLPADPHRSSEETAGILASFNTGVRLSAAKAEAPAPSPWRSAEDCERAWSLRSASAGPVRVATWNVRWFPDTTLDPNDRGPGTDVRWLGCAIAALDAPVIAVQEFRDHDDSRQRVEALIARLNELTQGSWRLVLDGCPDRAATHVGFLYDATRAALLELDQLGDLNPLGGCEGDLHPGLLGYFRFEGGLDTHVVSVHWRWGTSESAYQLRRRTRSRVGAAYAAARVGREDPDFVIAGDFNTNGCDECKPVIRAAEEVRQVASDLRDLKPPLRLVETDLPCSEYFDGEPFPLDQIAVAASMLEASPDTRVRVEGLCRLVACRPFAARSTAFYSRLSDHCPLVLEFSDRDLD